jgi:uncharacterized protein (TIGR00730 family)
MRVTIFGSARILEGSQEYTEGVLLGRLLASRGHTILSGGYGGAMEAVSRGAWESGGHVVGVTVSPWSGRLKPNAYLSEELAAETLFARIEALVEADGLIALPGGAGTLGEIALAWNLSQTELMPRKPVILVGSGWASMVEAFRANLIVGEHDLAMLEVVSTVDEAADALEHSLTTRGGTLWG